MEKEKIFFILAGFVILVSMGLALNSQKNEVPESQTINSMLEREIALKPGQSAYIESEGLKIVFIGISHDSRCPFDALCVWAGQVTAAFTTDKNSGKTISFSLGLGATEFSQESSIFGYSIKLTRVLS